MPYTVQTALIVGASRGLGLGLTQRLLQRGWQLIATRRRSAGSGLDDLADGLGHRLMLTNALSPMRCVERFIDLVPTTGTIGVMSSGQGSIANNTRVTGWEMYRASKSALNQLMRSFAARHLMTHAHSC